MLAPVILLLVAIGLGFFAWITQGSLPQVPLAELAAVVLAGALVLLVARLLRGGPRPQSRGGKKALVLDGSNILYWAGDGPDISTLRRVVSACRKAGYAPVVWFDANAGYLIEDRYAGPVRLAKLLAMPARDVFVAPKGEPADPRIIAAARAGDALIVTNDRYRDWQAGAGDLPRRLVRGRVAGRDVVLDWPKAKGR